MTRSTPILMALMIVSLITLYAVAQSQNAGDEAARHAHQHMDDHSHKMSDGSKISDAIAVLLPTKDSEASGVVRFHQGTDGKVTVNAVVINLKPNSTHGFHIHQYGDISDSQGKAAGDHYNPAGHKHGLPDESADQRHAGDFGNLEADASGKATYEATFDNITINGKTNPILGRGVIVHAEPDDGGQPTGNAGARIAQGVIGVAKAAE